MQRGRWEDAFCAVWLNSKECVTASRRFHLLLPAELEARLRDFARSRGIALGTALRQLASEGLTPANEHRRTEPSSVELATLTAAEHAVLMVASILPEGERRRRELAGEAASAAEARLAIFEADARG